MFIYVLYIIYVRKNAKSFLHGNCLIDGSLFFEKYFSENLLTNCFNK